MDAKTYQFKIAGISFCEDEIYNSLADTDDDYMLTPRQLSEFYGDGDRIYEFFFDSSNPKIIPEPDNPHDPNALRVEAGGIKIGYVKKNDVTLVKELLSNPNFKYYSVDIQGGNFKQLYEDEDEKLCADNDECPLFATLTIWLEDNEVKQQNETIKETQTKPKPLFEALSVILAVLSCLVGIAFIGAVVGGRSDAAPIGIILALCIAGFVIMRGKMKK